MHRKEERANGDGRGCGSYGAERVLLYGDSEDALVIGYLARNQTQILRFHR